MTFILCNDGKVATKSLDIHLQSDPTATTCIGAATIENSYSTHKHIVVLQNQIN